MKEIRISLYVGGYCEFPGNGAKRCQKNARQWKLNCGINLFYLCEEHGKQIIELFSARDPHHYFTITGGYDDEPKSKLAEIKQNLEMVGVFKGGGILNQIIDYLEEKERANDQ